MTPPPAGFSATLLQHRTPLTRARPEVLQLNTGRLCNLTCRHCHVNAGPARKEIITGETIDRILDWLDKTSIRTVDLTGGSPEMVPGFRRLVAALTESGRHVIDRLNATIITEPGYGWVPGFLAENKVEIIASMPCYEPENVDTQRGGGVFDRSIEAFRQLNALGYGRTPERILNFVYNPAGASLPPPQEELEADYRSAMRQRFGIEFHRLYTITNMPVNRFASWLKNEGRMDAYLSLLREHFNPATVPGLMCRTTLNVSWQGVVFDCDFNQMQDLPVLHPATGRPLRLWEVDPESFAAIPIRTGTHCFGCTAGCGSSCGGSLV